MTARRHRSSSLVSLAASFTEVVDPHSFKLQSVTWRQRDRSIPAPFFFSFFFFLSPSFFSPSFYLSLAAKPHFQAGAPELGSSPRLRGADKVGPVSELLRQVARCTLSPGAFPGWVKGSFPNGM